MIDTTTVRLSEHFLLSDFMGNHSVFTRGYANLFEETDEDRYMQLIANGQALCEHALEPILAQYGPMSISYGYISDYLSRMIVAYQDPSKPSHHRWDLGAAADICVHSWVNGDPDDDSFETAPIRLAHAIDQMGVPYSRLIAYSESPYLCVAVREKEIQNDAPRKAFYENRYSGKPKVKPDYFSRSTESARERAYLALQEQGLKHGWRGGGFPSYHGGGRRQYHHIRTSKYTMLSDWLFDLQSIANGAKNMPDFRDLRLWDVFCKAGDAYDVMVDATGIQRFSILSAFVSSSNPYFDPDNDWRSGTATFRVAVPPNADFDLAPSILGAYEGTYGMWFEDMGFAKQIQVTVEL